MCLCDARVCCVMCGGCVLPLFIELQSWCIDKIHGGSHLHQTVDGSEWSFLGTACKRSSVERIDRLQLFMHGQK